MKTIIYLFLLILPFGLLGQSLPGGFILESESNAVVIKPDSLYAKFSGQTQSTNVSIGGGNLKTVTTGQMNLAIGYNTMPIANASIGNTAIGSFALSPKNAPSILFNTVVGTSALEKLYFGNYNTVVGDSAMRNAAVASHNTAIGYGAMANLDSGSFNVAIGKYAGNAIKKETKNVVIGNEALRYNIQPNSTLPIESNVIIGDEAARNGAYRSTIVGDLSNSGVFQDRSTNLGHLSNFYTSRNTSIGNRTLNTASFQNPSLLKENTIVGNNAMRYAQGTSGLEADLPKWNTVIGHNSLGQIQRQGNVVIGNNSLNKGTLTEHSVVIGHLAGKEVTFGRRNTLIGHQSALNLTTGIENVVIGDSSAFGLISGSRNTLIGSKIQVTLSSMQNSTVIGSNVSIATSNTVQLGNPSVTSIGGFQPFTTYSDRKTKENIIYDNSLGLEFIKSLKTAKYSYNDDENQMVYDGLIAQDVEKSLKELGLKFPGLYVPKNENDTYAISYSALVVPLAAAVRELNVKTDELLEKRSKLIQRKNELMEYYEKAQLIINQTEKK